MVYRGHIRNGKIELDNSAALPEGAEVELSIVRRVDGNGDNGSNRTEGQRTPMSLPKELDRIWEDVPKGEWDNLPADLCDHLDHYLYGTPKK